MTNLDIMKKALNEFVINPLLKQGFVGKWPHYRRSNPNYIELISFQINKYGGSFTLELSAIFPNSKNRNYNERDDHTLDKINVWHTYQRYRLKGMYDGWFYYRDLYKKYIMFLGMDYLDISENDTDKCVPKGYKLVQQFDKATAEKISHCINSQLKKGFLWLKRFVKRNII